MRLWKPHDLGRSCLRFTIRHHVTNETDSQNAGALGVTLMKLVVFGANGATGRLLTQQAIEAGHEVTAVTRHADAFPLSHERLRVVRGDALDLASVKDAVAGQDAVISTLGVPYTRRPITIYSRSMANIIEAMHDQGVRRVIAVTSSALESPGTNGFLLEKILQPIIANTLGRTTYQDMRKMEALLRDSDLDWTVVRSNGLFAGDGVTPYEVAEGHITGKFTAREDLADLLLKEAERGDHVRKAIAIATREGTPSFFKFLLTEANPNK